MNACVLSWSEHCNIVCEFYPFACAEFGSESSDLRSLAAKNGRRIRYLDQHTEIGDIPKYGIIALERIW
jgi:hypothetical protein